MLFKEANISIWGRFSKYACCAEAARLPEREPWPRLGISSSTPREVASPATSPSRAAQGRSTPSAPSHCCLGALPRRPRALAAQLGPSLRQPRAPAAPPRGSSPPPALSCGHGARPCRLRSRELTPTGHEPRPWSSALPSPLRGARPHRSRAAAVPEMVARWSSGRGRSRGTAVGEGPGHGRRESVEHRVEEKGWESMKERFAHRSSGSCTG